MSDEKKGYRFETLQVHAGQEPAPGHERPGRPDLPDDVLHLRRRRPRGAALRAAGVREHLHPDHEPDHGRLREADRRPRGRRRGPRHRERPGRPVPRALHDPARTATTSSRRATSTAAPTTSSRSPSRASASARSSSRATIPADFAKAIDARTRALYVETIGNPRFNVPDFEALAKIAHDNGIPLVVDNTFGAAGYLSRPIDHGADIVVASATKWIGGHGTSIGGVDRRRREVRLGQRQVPRLHRARAGLPRPQLLGDVRPEGPLRQHRVHHPRPRRGAARPRPVPSRPSTRSCFLQGLETLSLRVAAPQRQRQRSSRSGWSKHPAVTWVSHPSLPDAPLARARAKKYLRHGFGVGADLRHQGRPRRRAEASSTT